MNMNKYEELRENTEPLGATEQFEIRVFHASGNFLVIDEDGDFIICLDHFRDMLGYS